MTNITFEVGNEPAQVSVDQSVARCLTALKIAAGVNCPVAEFTSNDKPLLLSVRSIVAIGIQEL